ncbi:MAG: immunity protein YezG family protein [Bacilli bacterium]
MENKLKELYQELAEKLDSMIPVEWDQLYYLGEVSKGYNKRISSVFYYTEADNKNYIRSHSIPEEYNVSRDLYLEFLRELNEILSRINAFFVENDMDEWVQLLLNLKSSGKSKFEFIYETIAGRDSFDNVKREVVWAYDTFGYRPEKGTYQDMMLEEYLNS